MMGSPLGESLVKLRMEDLLLHHILGPLVSWRNAFCFNPETKIRLHNHE